MLVPNLQSVVCSKRAPHSLMCSPAAGAMAGMRTNIQLSPSFRVLLLFTRSKTTRPQEWKDLSQFVAKVHPDQRREEETRNSRRHKWMDVRWKNKNTAETMIHSLAIDESRRSDPKEAKKISDAKILALRNSLSSKGFCREQKAYDPPDNVEEELQNALQVAIPAKETSPGQTWLNLPLSDPKIKFKFLLLCEKRLKHQVPNSDLYLMKTVRDVVDFYKEPVRGTMTFDYLVRVQKREELPTNLHVVPDMVSYDPNSDFMGGIDAFPGNPEFRQGLRDKMKYPTVKTAIPWPDI